MTSDEALNYILGRLPAYDRFLNREIVCDDEGALLHPAMGDFGRYYMDEARHEPATAATYWTAVEELASTGGQQVEEAVGASLIEWFVGGSSEERQALRDAAALQGEATKRMIADCCDDPRWP